MKIHHILRTHTHTAFYQPHSVTFAQESQHHKQGFPYNQYRLRYAIKQPTGFHCIRDTRLAFASALIRPQAVNIPQISRSSN
jgi:hypothetical protein